MAAETTIIEHILSSTAHQLELVPGRGEFFCFKCAKFSTGRPYRCKNCTDLALHQRCFSSVITHTLRYADKGPGVICDQCEEIHTGKRSGGNFYLHRGCRTSNDDDDDEEDGAAGGDDTSEGKSVSNNALNEENKRLEEENGALQEEKKRLEEENRALQADKKKLEEENGALLEEKKEREEEKTIDTGDGKVKLSIYVDTTKYVPALTSSNKLTLYPVAASSTYTCNDPGYYNAYVIENTVKSDGSGWMSRTNSSGRLNEWLIYALPSTHCNIVDEIQLRDEMGGGLDSNVLRSACFKIGSAKSSDELSNSDDNYHWIYTSEKHKLEYTKGAFRSFKLPFVPCIGGFLKIELSAQGSGEILCCILEVVVRGRQIPVNLKFNPV